MTSYINHKPSSLAKLMAWFAGNIQITNYNDGGRVLRVRLFGHTFTLMDEPAKSAARIAELERQGYHVIPWEVRKQWADDINAAIIERLEAEYSTPEDTHGA